MGTYRDDMRRAWERINSFPTQRLETRLGAIEYADQGEGVPLLVSHGVLGCHVDTVDSWWASLPGRGFRVIGPSRFGYFGSTLPKGATPADQADAYALLLDHLDVDRAVVIGFSAGSGSILELARRHPQRVIGLILACCRLGGGITTPKAFAPVFRLAYSADRLFWIFKKLIPTAYSRMMGMPKGYKPSPQEADAVAAGMNLLFPSRLGARVPSSTGSSRTWPRTGSPSSRSPFRRWSSTPGTTTRSRRIGSPPVWRPAFREPSSSASKAVATGSSDTPPRSERRSAPSFAR